MLRCPEHSGHIVIGGVQRLFAAHQNLSQEQENDAAPPRPLSVATPNAATYQTP